MTTPAPLILTLLFDQASFTRLDELRRTHFPPERNFIPAHVTLFHALPGEQEEVIRHDLHALASATTPFPLGFPSVQLLGHGVAVQLDAPELRRLRARLAAQWRDWLTPQDQQGYRPHVTIQNKVAREVARTLFEQLAASWHPWTGSGDGLTLWRYRGGPWQHVEDVVFAEE